MRSLGLRRAQFAAIGLMVALLAACSGGGGGGSASPSASGKPVIQLITDATSAEYQVAVDQGFYEGIDVNVSRVDAGDLASLVLASNVPVTGGFSPWEVAQYVSQGEKIKYISTAGGIFMVNGVIVRAADAGKYKSIKDLEGHKLGIPGFGTGTWAAFTVAAKQQYGIDDAKTAFEIVTADPGALIGLLDKGEIDGALEFSAQTLLALGQPDKFAQIYSFTDNFNQAYNQPMLISGLTARTDWLDEHPDWAKAIVQGVDKAIVWESENPDEFTKEDGAYADWSTAQGIFANPLLAQKFGELLKDQKYYARAGAYTQAWIDAQYNFIKAGEGTLVDKVPAKDDIFLSPDALK